MTARDYDVFLSYNRSDTSLVHEIAAQLRDRGLRVWLDEWEIQPGADWVRVLDNALRRSQAVAVFLGASGVGAWQDREAFHALEDHARAGRPVIPVLLPGAAPGQLEQDLPFLRRHQFVEFRSGSRDDTALDRLIWGITGSPPARRLPPAIADDADPLRGSQSTDAVIDSLRQTLKGDNVTFFIGGETSSGDSFAPSSFEIASVLLQELAVLRAGQPEEEPTLPPSIVPRLETVGDFFAVKEGPNGLEKRVAALVGRATALPATYVLLARLMRLLRNRPRRRRTFEARQLIMTTNFDVMIERALLLGGVPYTRIVQSRAGGRLTVNAIGLAQVADNRLILEDLEHNRETIQVDQRPALDDLIAYFGRVSDVTDLRSIIDQRADDEDAFRPILYKFRGSQDVPKSCAISSDQYTRIAARAREPDAIPTVVTATIASAPMLFIGYGPLDPDFRLMYHTVLSEAFSLRDDDVRAKYVLKQLPTAGARDAYGNIQAGIWEKIKLFCTRAGIAIVEADSEVFLRDLCDVVEQDIHS